MKETGSSSIQQKISKTCFSATTERINDSATKYHSHTAKYSKNSTEQYKEWEIGLSGLNRKFRMFRKFKKEKKIIGLEVLLPKKSCFELPQDPKNPQINSKDIFHVLNNNFSYTHFSFIFLHQKGSYYVHDDTYAIFFFLFRKILIPVLGFLSSFSFSSSESLWYLSQAFLCVFDKTYLPFSYKKNNIKIFITFLYMF